MSTKRIPFPRRRSAALVGVGLMLAQLASAGQPARVHFNYGQDDADDLCMMWDQVKADADGNAALTGHLYHRDGGACGVAPLPTVNATSIKPIQTPINPIATLIKPSSRAMDEDPASVPLAQTSLNPPSKTPATSIGQAEHPLRPVAGQSIRMRYDIQGAYPYKRLPEHVETNKAGIFHLTLPAPSLTGGVTVTAAYYGEEDESGQPLAKAEKKLITHVDVEVRKDGKPVDVEKNPGGPTATYTIEPKLLDWSGKPLTVVQLGDVELKRVVKSAPRTGFVAQLPWKGAKLEGLSVTGEGDNPGVVAVKVVTGSFESEPVLLPFGVGAKLERVDEHKDEELILQRPKGYNDNEGIRGQFFMDEHAELKLTLTSLLTNRPLKGVDVTWSVAPGKRDANRGSIGASLSPSTEEALVNKKSDKTNSKGVVAIPVSARHEGGDANGDKPSNGPAYSVAVGKALVKATINDQVINAEPIEFVDSLWLMAHPAEGAYGIPAKWTAGQPRRVDMVVDGYVDVDGKSTADRKFVPFRGNDHSVVPEPSAPVSSGPVYIDFVDVADKSKVILEPSNTDGESGHAGFAYRGNTNGTGLLTGYFKPKTTVKGAGTVCLEPQQNWNGNTTAWTAQAGVALKVKSGDLLCTKIVPETQR